MPPTIRLDSQLLNRLRARKVEGVRRRAVLALSLSCGTALGILPSTAWAVSSSELYTTNAYRYGRFEARMQFAFGDGVVSSFFLWKNGSETESAFWNELDFEKLRANCELETNALYGMPEMSHNEVYDAAMSHSATDLCSGFHTYAYEWTPDAIAWFIDGVEIRRETGEIAAAFVDNAAQGMELHFNVWPGDVDFGGNFLPSILPVHQYINWVQFSAYSNGTFELEWREDFLANSLPAGWSTGSWQSPKNLSTHSSANVTFKNGYAVLSLTADDATGAADVNPLDTGDNGSPPDQPDASPEEGANDAGGSPSVPTASSTEGAPSSSPTASATTTFSSSIPTAAAPSGKPAGSVSADLPMSQATGSDASNASPSSAPSSSQAASTSSASTGTSGVASSMAPFSPAVSTASRGCDCEVARSNIAKPWPLFAVFLALSFSRVRRSQQLNKL